MRPAEFLHTIVGVGNPTALHKRLRDEFAFLVWLRVEWLLILATEKRINYVLFFFKFSHLFLWFLKATQ